VSARTILGLLSVYLLIGMTFAALFVTIAVISDEPFFAQIKTAEPVDFTYFSFVTLSTVGYGDLTEPDASDARGHRGSDRSVVSGHRRCGRGVQGAPEEETTARGLTLAPLLESAAAWSATMASLGLAWAEIAGSFITPDSTLAGPNRTGAAVTDRSPADPDEHRQERPVLLAVDQQLGEGAALRVAPELADPVGPLEVGQQQDVE
jgi:hypothetical protein